jgi:hypothetical protein
MTPIVPQLAQASWLRDDKGTGGVSIEHL